MADIGLPCLRVLPPTQAPNQEALCYKDRYEEWEQQYACKVITSTRDSFQDMFDDDNTLAYEPESTAAVIVTGGDEEAEAAALEVEALLLRTARDCCQNPILQHEAKGCCKVPALGLLAGCRHSSFCHPLCGPGRLQSLGRGVRLLRLHKLITERGAVSLTGVQGG